MKLFRTILLKYLIIMPFFSSQGATIGEGDDGPKRRRTLKQTSLASFFDSYDKSEGKKLGSTKTLDVLMGIEFSEKEGATIIVDRPTEDDDWERHKIPIMGEELEVYPQSERRCFGVYDLKTHVSTPCPSSRLVEKRYRNCFQCNKAIGFNPAFYLVPPTSLSSQQQTYNNRPHDVYLVAFSPDIVKVGIAQQDRILIRLTEQGARLAFILGSFPNAYAAREIERKLARETGIREGVAAREKFSLLKGPLNSSEVSGLTAALMKTTKIARKLDVVLPERGFLNLDSYYFGERSALPGSLVRKTISSSSFRGKVVGCVGDILFMLSNRGDIFKVSLKPFFGMAKIKVGV